MNAMRPPLFDLARQRLLWAEQRQTVLARNIANASTPGFLPRDLPSFADAMGRKNLSEPRRTQPNHLPRPQGSGLHAEQAVRPRAKSPDGNAVAMDEQLTKVADTDTAQNMTTSIYRKYMAMFSIALGKA